MGKLVYGLLAIVILIALGACADRESSNPNDEQKRYTLLAKADAISLSEFGADGIAILPAVNFKVQVIRAQSNGKLIVGGYSLEGAEKNNFRLARVKEDGELDLSFGNAGIVSTHFGFGDDFLNDLAIGDDDSIVAVGRAFGGVNDDLAVARYHSDGSLDLAFGSNGLVRTDLQPGSPNTYDNGNALLLQTDGKIVVVGETHTNCKNILARYLPDGQLDKSFGTAGTGIVIIRFSGNHDTLNAVAFSTSGQIITAGTIADGRDFAATRLSKDGILDTTIGVNGIVILNMGAVDKVSSVGVRPDGKILISGYTGSTTNQSMIALQLLPSGALDTGWASGGSRIVKLDSSKAGLDRIHRAELLPDGSLLAVGQAREGNYLFSAVLRLTAEGSLDSGFGSGGLVAMSINSDSNEALYGLVRRGSNWVMAGNASYPGVNSIVLRQLDLSGQIVP